jgi:hypothetical protein
MRLWWVACKSSTGRATPNRKKTCAHDKPQAAPWDLVEQERHGQVTADLPRSTRRHPDRSTRPTPYARTADGTSPGT